MTSITHLFNGPFSYDMGGSSDTPEQQLRNEIQRAGLNPPEQILLDGVFHRFKSTDGKKDKSGWYVAFGDGVPAGSFGCFRQGIEHTWRADVGHELTPEENAAIQLRMEESRQIRKEERERERAKTADAVLEIWSKAPAASINHPYLKAKGIEPYGARIMNDGRLAVPLYDEHGKLSTLQYISSDGEKRYHPGGATGGKFWMIGADDEPGVIYIAEGFATAATIHRETGRPCVVAYSANNLPPVTKSIREIYGATQELVIVADNDESGVGQNYAEQASAKHGADVIVIPDPGDANDYHQSGNDLKSLLAPVVDDDWLVDLRDWASESVDIKWLVKGWLRRDALMRVFGPSGHGKTFVVLDWALSIASGREWNGHKTNRGAVAYLAGEGHAGLKSRALAWIQEHGMADDAVIKISKSGCSLNTPEGYQQARRSIAMMKTCDLIVIDTQHAFYEGEENSAKDAKTMIDACKALIQEFNASVLLVHHTGVNEETSGRARGSGSFKGAMDIELLIHRLKSSPDTVMIRYSKAKDTEELEPVHMQFKSVELAGLFDEDGDPVRSAIMQILEADEVESVKKDRDPVPNYVEHRQNFENAWLGSGMEIQNGLPYLTRSALRDFMINTTGLAARSVENQLRPGRKNGLINLLLEHQIIQDYAAGWVVIDQITVSSMLIQRRW